MEMEPGQLFLKEEDIICNAGRTAYQAFCNEYRGSSCANWISLSLL